MCLTRTKSDVLKAYKVYKHASKYLSNIPPTENEMYVLISTLTTLYGGLTLVELPNVLPVSKACIKRLVNNGIRRYCIFNYDTNLALGRDTLGTSVVRGVLTLKPHILEKILKDYSNEVITTKDLNMFATLLSNTSAHVRIIRDNVKETNSTLILSHIRTLFDMIVNKQLSSSNTCLENLARLGYMRIREHNIELNKSAILYNKEAQFEVRTV